MASYREEVKAGITVVTAFLILSAFVILIGGSRFYEKYDHYYVRVKNVAGLEVGAQVRLGGVRVGRVLSIKEPTEPGKPVTIEVGVRGGTPVYQGTKAMISQIGMVGDIYLLLAVENTTSGRINPGQEIPSEDTMDFGKMMAKLNSLSDTADSLLKDVDKVFSPKNVDNVGALLVNTNKAIVSGSANIEQVAASLKNTSEKLQVVLNEINDVVKTNKGGVSALIAKAQDDLDKAGEMIKSIDTTVKTVGKATGNVDRVLGRQSQNLDNLIDSMTRTTEDLQDVLQELKAKPWSVIYKEGKVE